MKIQSLTGLFNYSPRIREKQDGQSAGQSPQHQERRDPTAAEKDGPLSESKGLEGALEGEEVLPGLRVELKEEGIMVQQMTGEEFVRLRQELKTHIKKV